MEKFMANCVFKLRNVSFRNYRFFALLGYDADFDFSFLDIKNR
jgi:hypothetical protein